MLPTFPVGKQEQDPREDEEGLSRARRWQGELFATQRLPLVTQT